MKKVLGVLSIAAALAGCALFKGGNAPDDIVLETETFTLRIGSDACAKSLVMKATGEECLDASEKIPLFTSTQKRPFNNEVKLAWSNKQTTYPANRLRKEGDTLVAGFHIAPYEAIIRYKLGKGYIAFTLEDFKSNKTDEKQYRGLCMDVPPVQTFRVVQLPVKNRKYFGDWLNVSWDEKAVTAVVGAEPLVDIDHENRDGFKILRADLMEGMSLRGGTAAIVAGGGKDEFMDSMDHLEEDFNLPRGVQSRRSDKINASIYWTYTINPGNVDKQIALAKQGGFSMMLIYYPAITGDRGYGTIDYYRPDPKHYPNGYADVKAMLDKITAAGITPGLHCLQTHIGLKGKYCTPVADSRLNLTRNFTLAKPLAADDATIYVNENPVDAMQDERCRILMFGGELIRYAGYSTKKPYCFTGCQRGACKTIVHAHPAGERGGTLDVSEFGATSCYVDQRTDLQDEVGANIAKIYDCGFRFCYFDGSEGVNPPCGINVPYAQYRVTRQFKTQPLFTEGAAKGHFGWHLQAGANAFDVFPPEEFKEKIMEYPAAEAPLMRQDFTRLDFGWWGLRMPETKIRWSGKEWITVGTQSDMWEFGTSRAAAWDCPATLQVNADSLMQHPRKDDLLEVMKRWEEMRAQHLLTPEMKEQLKSGTQEHHLLRLPCGKLEIVEIDQLAVAGNKDAKVRAFIFERKGVVYVTYWHISGKGSLTLPMNAADVEVTTGFESGAKVPMQAGAGSVTLPAEGRVYLKSALSREATAAAFVKATIK